MLQQRRKIVRLASIYLFSFGCCRSTPTIAFSSRILPTKRSLLLKSFKDSNMITLITQRKNSSHKRLWYDCPKSTKQFQKSVDTILYAVTGGGESGESVVSTTSSSLSSTKKSSSDGGGGLAPPFSVTIETTEDGYSYKEAIQRTIAWITAAFIFGSSLWFLISPQAGEEFFAGYIVEQSLSVDNLFVFLLLFEYFQVPLQHQDRVLNWGIYGAIVMRAIMIGAGVVALSQFREILLGFAAILIYGSVKFFVTALGSNGNDDDEEDLSENQIIKLSKNLFQSTNEFDGNRFFVIRDGVRMATPLFLCLVAVEISDVVFAVDSVPAVFGVTEVRGLFVRMVFLSYHLFTYEKKM